MPARSIIQVSNADRDPVTLTMPIDSVNLIGLTVANIDSASLMGDSYAEIGITGGGEGLNQITQVLLSGYFGGNHRLSWHGSYQGTPQEFAYARIYTASAHKMKFTTNANPPGE